MYSIFTIVDTRYAVCENRIEIHSSFFSLWTLPLGRTLRSLIRELIHYYSGIDPCVESVYLSKVLTSRLCKSAVASRW